MDLGENLIGNVFLVFGILFPLSVTGYVVTIAK